MGAVHGVSRLPPREALKAFSLMGVLESRKGGRHTVTDLSPQRLVAPFNVMLGVGDYDVQEHSDARAIDELELIRLSELNASAAQRAVILRHAVDGQEFIHDPVAFRLLDIEFHQSLNDAGGNRLMSALSQGLYDIVLDVRPVASTFPGIIEKSVAQHIAVARAVMDGDALPLWRQGVAIWNMSTTRPSWLWPPCPQQMWTHMPDRFAFRMILSCLQQATGWP